MKVEIHNNGARYTLLEPVAFPIEGVTVPAGFVTDFASVPKILWSIFPPTGWYQRAALLHDYLYVCRVLPASRWEADCAFLRQMRLDGVGARTRWTLFLAVRLFGGRHFRRSR